MHLNGEAGGGGKERGEVANMQCVLCGKSALSTTKCKNKLNKASAECRSCGCKPMDSVGSSVKELSVPNQVCGPGQLVLPLQPERGVVVTP